MNTSTSPRVLSAMQALGDPTRSRLLALLARHEFTVSELCSIVQAPQPSVSRHLRVLAEDGWVKARADGTSRHYRLSATLDEAQRALWEVVDTQFASAPVAEEDQARAALVLSERESRSREFFSRSAARWDDLREEMFGRGLEDLPLFGLLDPEWTVADLGTGTGALAKSIAPFVRHVIAVDRSPEMIDAARGRLAGSPNVDLRTGALEALPIEDGSVDVAFLLLVLHHVAAPERALLEVARVLRAGGRLIVVDMREHGRDEYIEEMGHHWTGFAEARMQEWAEGAGLGRYTQRTLPSTSAASGPLLFVASAVKQ